MTLKQLAAAYKEPFAWPGGYPVYIVLSDGCMLCSKCFKSEYSQLVWDIVNECNTGWRPAGRNVLYEGPEYCGHCSDKLESAYGDVDNE